MQKIKAVSKEEFDAFVKAYPRPLVRDVPVGQVGGLNDAAPYETRKGNATPRR